MNIKSLRFFTLLLAMVVTSVSVAQPPDGFRQRGEGGPGGPPGGGGPGGGPGGGGGFGGGRGFGGRGGGGMMGMGDNPFISQITSLRDEEVTKELGISEEQQTQLQELSQTLRPGREEMMEMFGRMREAQNDEERAKIGQEIFGPRIEAAQKKMNEILSEAQRTRLAQLTLQRSGIRGITQSATAEELKLTDEQKTKLGELNQEYEQARRELGRGASSEERDQARDEFLEKAKALLTDEQKGKYKSLLGPAMGGEKPVASTQSTEKKDDSEEKSESSSDSSKPAVAMQQVDENQPSVADFGVINSTLGTEPGETVNTMTFNFRNAPWVDVLELFARATGLTLDLEATPPGAFNYIDTQSFTPAQALDVLNGYLIPRGYVLLQRDRFLVVTQLTDGLRTELVPTVSLQEIRTRGETEYVKVLLSTGDQKAEDFVDDVKKMLGEEGQVFALGQSNRLIAMGSVRSLREVIDLLEQAAPPVDPQKLAFRAFKLQYVPAVEAEPMVRALLGVDMQLGGSSSGRSSDPRAMFMQAMASRFGGGDRGRDRDRGGSSSSAASSTQQARVALDERSNMLLVTAIPSELLIAEQAIKEIDTPEAAAQSLRDQQANGPVVRVYPIDDDYAELSEIAETLQTMIPGLIVNQDRRADALHVIAPLSRQEEVAALIRQLMGGAGTTGVAVLSTQGLDPSVAGQMVVNMFSQERYPPTVQIDPYGGQLIVRGTTEQITQARTVMAQLTQQQAAVAARRGPAGPVRQIPLGGRDPETMLKLLKQLWSASHDTPINVVRPGVDADKTPQVPAQQSRGTQAIEQQPASEPSVYQWNKTVINAKPVSFLQETPAATEETESAAADSQTTPGSEKINIGIIGDRFIISSSNQELLDEMEGLINSLQQQVQPRTQWSVYYLRAALVDDVVLMLEQLLPEANVGSALSSLSSSIDSLSSSGSSFQIIPDARTNALFVTGSAEQIQDLEQMLKVLDATELPDSLRDRVPRNIPVMYADVQEVAQIIKDVYADQLIQVVNNRGRDGQEQSSLTAGKLTVGIDSQSSQVVVSCDDSTYQQIVDLVESIDQAAYEARRSIRVIDLQYTDPSVMQSTLGSLIPKVTVTTSSSSSSSRSSSSGNASSNNRGRDNNSRSSGGQDDVRRFFEERMRQRGGDRGSRGGDRGSRSGFGGGGFPFGGGGPPGFGGRGR